MRLVSFEHQGNRGIGVLQPAGLVDMTAADGRIPSDMAAFLALDAEGWKRAADAVSAAGAAHLLDPGDVTMLAPVPNPGKIICIGLNYADHVAESGADIPEYPEVFCKYPSAVVGPNEPIVLPRVSAEVDYEAELGVVVGSGGRHIAEDGAMDHVAGYVCFHDVSARDYQMRTSQWTLGKSFDTFAPMGPALVTRDEIPDPHDLGIRTRVNGETLQDSRTKHLIFRIPRLIAELSAVMTLEPGDVIATGTPPGVGFARKPPRYLQPGDIVEIDIDGVGVLSNPVVAETE